ncbi:hypothetical protein VPNG_06782 [Cytospora leucostoma]|uniref:Uncharacterized protein n=1 Tax=Cytospora leucostoma TaxID=1230097 RepID=A0A423WVQ6_9PEZI|nr:hypothetical protein VPNG_06782 [Cytospora leucostoma]
MITKLCFRNAHIAAQTSVIVYHKNKSDNLVDIAEGINQQISTMEVEIEKLKKKKEQKEQEEKDAGTSSVIRMAWMKMAGEKEPEYLFLF